MEELARIDVSLFEPFPLPAAHYFFVPQVDEQEVKHPPW